jgi:hypothetical protein
MNPDLLKRLQDQLLSTAKHLCLEDGRLTPTSFIFASRADMASFKAAPLLGITCDGLPCTCDREPEWACAVCPWPSTPHEKFDILRNELSAHERSRMDTIIDCAGRFGVPIENQHASMIAPLCRWLEIPEDDVGALGIRQLCAELNALAIITVSSDCCIHSVLETPVFVRSLDVPILRDASVEPNPVTGYGVEIETSTADTCFVAQRANLLRPQPPQARA